MKKQSKESTCIRNTSTWGDLKAEYKFDSSSFNPSKLISRISVLSPKMYEMMKKIEELDKMDMEKDGKMYKHIIYSDVAGIYGAKMIASVLIANGYKLVYDKSNKLVQKSPKSFALLTTSTVYQKPMPMGLKKNIIQTINKRPDNIYGDNIRFLVIDSGFKEGIDVFDVKYVHLLEPLVTKAEQTQVIGRGTRFCGQKGLPFIPYKGWPLQVFRYNMMYDENISAHELYLKHCDNNISSLNFVADIEDLLITSAVDLTLTNNIHHFDNTNNRFYNMMKLLRSENKKAIEAKMSPQRLDRIKIIDNIRGKIYTNDKDGIKCEMRCTGKLEHAHLGILLVAAIHVGKQKLIQPLMKRFPKGDLCQEISKIPEYCQIINMIWKSPIHFFKIYGKQFRDSYNYYKSVYLIDERNIGIIDDFIAKYENPQVVKQHFPAVPPKSKMSYLELQDYVDKHYSDYEWEAMEISNKCIEDKKEDNHDANLITLTNTQKFVKDFMTHRSPYNGMFLYHSVGSGKTCTAIATATSTFEKQGYTILWVTRHTLKQDIWKNMFDSVCSIVIQEKVKKGERIPTTRAERMKMLSDNWMQPISYKQFTNMIAGKNKLYKEMVQRNGKEDPFNKTFIIIDEIHKIYSNTLGALEKPNPKLLKEMVQHSYGLAEKNLAHIPVKLLLMSATPITEDPMSVIKIMNLLLSKNDEFSEDFEEFRKDYCNENGIFTDEGAIKFLNKVSGLVSYIDRTNDMSHFAYPIITDIMLRPSVDSNNENVNKLNETLRDEEVKLIKLETLDTQQMDKKQLKSHEQDIKQLKKTIKTLTKKIKEKISNVSSNNIVEYINSCFVKGVNKPKSLKRSYSKSLINNSVKEYKSSDIKKNKKNPKPTKAEKGQKECPKGKVLNPTTGRCIKDKGNKVEKVKKEKAPKPAKAEKGQKECPEGKVLNPTTGRCNKIKN